jgi:hypothetical protein
MAYPKHVWDQLKNKTCDDLIRALGKTGWMLDTEVGATTGSVRTLSRGKAE